ncbi:MAG: hypothetical protein KatS3mg051_2049 [Anaerolineae bacterium]|nr:MAG: hypothetical protein KatS3mg051_2049 [Anaerolineae bacterium]
MGNVYTNSPLHVGLNKATIVTSTAQADAALTLDQRDLSEEFIDFRATVGTGNPIQTGALGTYYGKIRVAVNGTFKYIPLYNS